LFAIIRLPKMHGCAGKGIWQANGGKRIGGRKRFIEIIPRPMQLTLSEEASRFNAWLFICKIRLPPVVCHKTMVAAGKAELAAAATGALSAFSPSAFRFSFSRSSRFPLFTANAVC